MKICHSLIFFFLTLQDGNIGLISAKIPVFKKTEGETIILKCPFEWSLFDTGKKIFCRNECEKGDVLVETSVMYKETGRYSIRKGSSDTELYVTIRQLKESDSGLYRCVLDRLGPDEYAEFRIKVTKKSKVDNETLKPSSTHQPSVNEREPTSALTTTSASGTTELSFSSSSTSESEHQQTTTVDPGPATGLYVSLTVVVIVILAPLLVFCKKRTNKPAELHVDTEYDLITDERLREFMCHQLHSPQTGDSSCLYTCCELDFSDQISSWLSSAPQSQTTEVVYRVTLPQQQRH
ncbi:triggering receptor expressed on myeloid cells 1-like isoform X1 [Sphaeramia orbicularis]|uniref:triggering receptor expressed on myeloid cells 1-like isoform X1 n=1 Tax=Sphaeramia orbicularis TaxID=375764 RepID=UPI00117DA007|nr:triggering receptor expressed on myeloid cells 1-like isoform X1 [Sphaeramia orbicularis]